MEAIETKHVDEWSNKVIQQVPMKDGNHIYICDFDMDKYLLSIRMANSANMLQVLTVTITATTVQAERFDFHINFLNQFLFANSEHYDKLIDVK